ncbi:MAG: hypothetical protein HC925_08485 [Coleofasciculaceae cyanobacterium SM2_3_26]|nr:hypothetical protein [Coleofasciculaceae cyanobacterium SM2_3_26]
MKYVSSSRIGMSIQAATLVGIDRYPFQTLRYAQQDAWALRQLLVEEAGWHPDRCVCLSETSPPVGERSAYPDKENILGWLDVLCKQDNLDTLWFFFSGYGMTYRGEDYLMPIDGNPDCVEETGIAARSLFAILKQATTQNQLVLLDINRAPSLSGANEGNILGTHIADVAREMEIPVFFSCKPNQFSRETAALRHGFFTAALIEALRHNQCTVLEDLERFLGDRLPELTAHHWYPRQDPTVILYPPTKVQQPLLVQTPVAIADPSRNGEVATFLQPSPPPANTNGTPRVAPIANPFAMETPSESPSDNQPTTSASAIQPDSSESEERRRGSWFSGQGTNLLLLLGILGILLLILLALFRFSRQSDPEGVPAAESTTTEEGVAETSGTEAVPSEVVDPAATQLPAGAEPEATGGDAVPGANSPEGIASEGATPEGTAPEGTTPEGVAPETPSETANPGDRTTGNGTTPETAPPQEAPATTPNPNAAA